MTRGEFDDAMDAGWCAGIVRCRCCLRTHASVWPADIDDEDAQECPHCGAFDCEVLDAE